jgi:hypothetical protein
MNKTSIPAEDRLPRRRARVLDTEMSYVTTGHGDPIVFLHGNPTSSYLWRNARAHFFRDLRSEAGERMVLDENFFIEALLPKLVMRPLGEIEMEAYRCPFQTPPSRLPMLIWPRELPIGGEPADVVAIVKSYGQWLLSSTFPKLFVNAEPGSMLIGRSRDFCRRFQTSRRRSPACISSRKIVLTRSVRRWRGSSAPARLAKVLSARAAARC